MKDVITGRKVKNNLGNPANRKRLNKFEMDVEYGNVLMDGEE